jgi:hypothetical protein
MMWCERLARRLVEKLREHSGGRDVRTTFFDSFCGLYFLSLSMDQDQGVIPNS